MISGSAISLDASPLALAAGVVAVTVAASVIIAACTEPAPIARVPLPVVLLSAAWSAAFLASGVNVAVTTTAPFAAGLLVAASELCAAATIWFARSPRGGGGDDDHRGPDADEPDRPPEPSVPDEYWRLWEEQLSGLDAISASPRDRESDRAPAR